MANSVAYGFWDLQSLFNTRVSAAGPQRVYDAVVESAAEYSRVANALLEAEWTERTIDAQEQFELPGTGTLQPLDEFGNPIPVQPSGYYQVAYPIFSGGTAWGDDRITRELMTVEEANRNTLDAESRDKDWLLRHFLASLFTNTTYTYNDKYPVRGAKALGDITIQPLANADSVTYKLKGASAPATDTHFLAQANAISDSDNPFPAIYTELNEHPSNGNRRILCYIPTNLKSSVIGLANFVPVDDPDVVPGDATARVTNVPQPGVGDRVLGHVDNVWIIEWGFLPSGYMIAKAEGIPVVAMREIDAPALQGFFPEKFSPDGNRMITRMLRYCGFAVRRRVSALVYRVGNGAYAIPSGYTAPLAV